MAAEWVLPCPLQVQEITQAVTPLLRTFSIGILQNPNAFGALQNFTTSASTQALLSGLRTATNTGLPALQQVLVSHLCASFAFCCASNC